MTIQRLLSALAISLLPLTRSVEGIQQTPTPNITCNHPPYTVHIFAKAPLVIYISNFLTLKERIHLEEARYVLCMCSLARSFLPCEC